MPQVAAVTQQTSTPVCLADFEAAARRVIPPMAWEYIAGGAGDEHTLRWNVDAFARIRLRPRVLVDVSRVDTRARLFGMELALPLLLAPAAYHRLVHDEGERATARGAAAAGVPYVVSTATTTTLTDIAAAAPNGLRWLQLYLLPDRGRTRALVEEAAGTGCRALCLTVDTPVGGVRNREQRTGFQLPDGVTAPYFHHLAQADGTRNEFQAVTWRDVAWLRDQTALPVLLKGILTGDDAARAVGAGVAGIVVSNHGARNLDTLPATIDALPEVAAAVAGRIPILLDGGVRRGTDILKALALGATAVMIGRPYLYGLAVRGAEGIGDVVRILQTEFAGALALTGRATASEVDRTVIW
jgi:4-hydroxymandelate oxidase